MMASLGLVELSRYDTDTLTKRKHICNRYAAALKKKQWAELPIQKNNEKESSYHLFALRIKGIDESTRDKIIESIFEKNVSVNVHFIPLPLLTFYKNKGFRITDYPKAYQFFSCEISLPVFYDLTDEMIDTVLDAVISSVEQHI